VEALVATGFGVCACKDNNRVCINAMSISHPNKKNPVLLRCKKAGKLIPVAIAEKCTHMRLVAARPHYSPRSRRDTR
jgi:hypothetical protein